MQTCFKAINFFASLDVLKYNTLGEIKNHFIFVQIRDKTFIKNIFK